jgi:soluble lytic murein transglycosylase-like protein
MKLLVFFVCLLVSTAAVACNLVTASQYKRDLAEAAKAIFGPLAPISALAAQIHLESCWNTKAVSSASAKGLAQFIDPTARGVAKAYPSLSPADPFNPKWAFRAQGTLLLENLRRYKKGRESCSAWLMAWASYNGSPAALDREVALCRKTEGCDPSRWFNHVEKQKARVGWAWNENRAYGPRILARQPIYYADGWGPGVCQ